MKFGKVEHPELIDYTLPKDHPMTKKVLSKGKRKNKVAIYVGCAKWNRKDLKGFYPRGTKDELAYYATQFNSIELNATFYRIYSPEQIQKWKNKVPVDFKFFPKVSQSISQFKRLKNVQWELDSYTLAIEQFEENLGMVFLQMHPTFKPTAIETLKQFLLNWPKHLPIAIELRHPEWHSDKALADALFAWLQEHNISTVITDAAGRRDMLHQCLTTKSAFIRWNGANHPTDYSRLDDWVIKLQEWVDLGIENIYFFVHQNHELESPLLSGYFIKQLNEKLNANLKVPAIAQQELF